MAVHWIILSKTTLYLIWYPLYNTKRIWVHFYRNDKLSPIIAPDVFMSDLLQKVSIANKTIMLMGNFNIDLLKYDTNADSRVFLDLVFLA